MSIDENTTADDKIGRSVVFLGFPLNIGITYREKEKGKYVLYEDKIVKPISFKEPIFSNVIAKYLKISSNLLDNGSILIDAMVSHGNSGSPVFVRSGSTDGNKSISRYDWIGIVKSFRSDNIKYYSDNREEISIPHNTGIGEVISIDTIRLFLNDVKLD